MNEEKKFFNLSENVKAIVNLIQMKDGETLSFEEYQDLKKENSSEDIKIALCFVGIYYDYPYFMV